MFANWVKYHFRDVEHARLTLSIVGGSLGLIGMAIFAIGVLLHL
jgi:hypothetical protein